MFTAKKRMITCRANAFNAFKFISAITASYAALKLFENNAKDKIESTFEKDITNILFISFVSVSIMSASYVISSLFVGCFVRRSTNIFCKDHVYAINSELYAAENPYPEGAQPPDDWRKGGMYIDGSDSYDLFPQDRSELLLSEYR